MRYHFLGSLFLLGVLSLEINAVSADTPKLLVTLKPVHALVSGLTKGISHPVLLLDGMQSPHDYQLRPSERRLLESADIIIYTSDNIESFILPMRDSLGKRRLIALDKLPGLALLPARGSHTDHHADNDGHIWLSPVNAIVIVKQLADILIKLDPANTSHYMINRDHQIQRLDQLHRQLTQQLLPIRHRPFLQFHDALQYFERDYVLDHGIAVTSGAEHAPGARHVRALQQQISDENIRCFLYEPPQPPKLLRTLDVKRNATLQALEIHGSQMKAGEDLYFDLIQDIATKIHSCLQQEKEH